MSIDLSIVIVNYNTRELTLACIDSIEKLTKGIKYEIVLVENSTEEQISRYKDIKILRNKTNVGYARANNQGIEIAKGRYVLLLNSDTLLHDNVLGEMVEWMDANPKIGISSCALKNADGSLQGTGGYFPTLLRVFSWMTIQDLPFVDTIIKPFHPKGRFYRELKEVDWVTGAFMLIRRTVIDKVKGLDVGYFMYTEDTDYCYRAKRAGFKIVYNPKWSITHFGGRSSDTREFPILSEFKGVKIFYKKHYPMWQYPILRILLKLGCLWRIVLVSPKVYAKAFIEV